MIHTVDATRYVKHAIKWRAAWCVDGSLSYIIPPLATHCGSLTKPRPGRLLDPDLMPAENADSAGLTRFPIWPPTFACSAGPTGAKRVGRIIKMRPGAPFAEARFARN